MSTFILGPFFLKTKGGFTTTQAYYPGFMAANNNFGTYGRAYTNNASMTLLDETQISSTITDFDATPVSRNTTLIGGPAGTSKLMIFKGTKPALSAVTDLSAYNSQKLITFDIPTVANGGARFANGISPTSSPKISATQVYRGVSMVAGICPNVAIASDSGTPTWFWFGNYSDGDNVSDQSFVIGDISNTENNDFTGDLHFVGDVVAGQYYSSSGFKMDIPAFYTI
jgi:hypothetical protein